jgi:hypothetical protein
MSLLARLIERFRPTAPSDWSNSAWGDVPALPSDLKGFRNLKSSVFHIGTTTANRERNHAAR